MSFLFRCCCRPFLKGGDDGRREFYDLLEVSQDASTEEIKRAYKRKSLALHPDKLAQRGQVLTPEDQARFQRVKEAYEVLVDDKRRDLYDEFGESGMKIIDDPQSVDPQTMFTNFMKSSTLDRCAIFATILGVTAFVLLWPILLCLQTDRRIHIPWVAIWTPLWCVDAVLLFMLWFLVALGRSKPPEGLEEEWTDDLPRRLLDALQFSCNVLFQVFLTLKLDKTVPWPWEKVFAPWLAWEGIQLYRNIDTVKNGSPGPEMGSTPEERGMIRAIQVRQAVLGVQNGILRIIFVALAILKLDGRLHTTWWAVFTPLWLYFGGMFLGICVEASLAARMKEAVAEAAAAAGRDPEAPASVEEEMYTQQAEIMASRASMLGCQACVLLVMALLAVGRIEGAHYSVFLVFVPVFAVVGCFTCSLGCAVCCLRGDPEMMNAAEGMPLNPAAQAGSTGGATQTATTSPGTTATAAAGGSKPAEAAAGGAAEAAYQPPVASPVVVMLPSGGEQPQVATPVVEAPAPSSGGGAKAGAGSTDEID